MAWPYQRGRWESNPLGPGCSRLPCRLAPASHHPVSSPGVEPGLRPSRGRVQIPHTPRTFVTQRPAEELNLVLQLRGLPCCPAHPQGLRCQCLDQESDLDLDLRRVLCDPLHHRDVQTRADDWICTSIERFTGPLPFCSATSASTSARSRTPCGRVGACLLSQEHTRVSPPATRTGGFGVTTTSATPRSSRLR